MFELKQKAIKAAATFLDRRGYEVIDTEWESEDGSYIDVVARDENAIVFCDVQARRGVKRGMPEESLGTRERMEINAAKWLGEHGDDLENVDVAIRFDQIAMLVIGEDRALLKYHINCLGPGTIAAATE